MTTLELILFASVAMNFTIVFSGLLIWRHRHRQVIEPENTNEWGEF